jgi:protein-tyrosine phosphatase
MLAGAANFRAVAPYKAADGKTLRVGTLYRSGELSRLTEADLKAISALNIRLICDLRSAREQTEFASRWPAAPVPRRLDLPDRGETDAGPHKIFELIVSNPGSTGAVKAMQALYRRKPHAYANGLKILVETIVQGDALPLLVHCHAGKDRTGFITAMLLAAVGVSKADIIDDYLKTATFYTVERESLAITKWAKQSFNHEIDPASALPLVDTRPEYLEAAFQEIDTLWGGIDPYLQNAAALTSDLREALKAQLLA